MSLWPCRHFSVNNVAFHLSVSCIVSLEKKKRFCEGRKEGRREGGKEGRKKERKKQICTL